MAKVVVTMPDNLLEQVDSAVKKKRTNRSQFLREALLSHLEELRQREFEALMAEGYQEMAAENIADAMSYLRALDRLENQENG